MIPGMMNFRELVEKAPDADLFHDMVDPCSRCFAADRLMKLEVGAVTGAAYGENDPGRQVQRTGYRDRSMYASMRNPRRARSTLQDSCSGSIAARSCDA